MMSLVMANSGAEKAVLLLKGENEWFVQARKDITTDEPTALFYQPFDPTDRETELIPESVFNYCTRTKDVLVLGDAQLDQRFAEDRMIQKYKIRSIACLPALSQGELKAMLYLENRQTADVFSSENVGLLKHLSAQFAISVENTFLYNNLNQLVEERTAQLQQEVTERKRTESELQAQINLVDTLLTTAWDTIEVFDPDTLAYIKWNKACTDVTGYSDEEFATMNPATSFFDEADARRVEAGIDQVMKVGHTIVTADLIAKDGRRTPMEFLGSLSRDADGNPQYFISIGRDITERKKAAEALQASEEKYRDIVEKVSDVIYAVDAQGILTFASTAIESLLGISADEAVGKDFTELFLPEDLELINQNFVKLISGIVLGPKEYRILTASGETRWIGLSSQPIVKDGQVTGLQGVLIDITERKKMEKRLEEDAATEERDRLARRLHDAVTQTLFSASVIAESTPRFMENNPELAERNLEQLASMLRGALAEMRSLLIELRPEALAGKSLDELLPTLVDASQIRLNCPIDLEIEGESDLPEDVTIVFYRVAQEAITNIIKYAEADKVSVKVVCDEDDLVMVVKDNGRGFKLDEIPPGHFGLSMMTERIDQIGGELTIDSKPGHGTQIKASWAEGRKGVDRE
jgi:PAS domain S-box-containing protein